jgi:AraC-like DNA-binding protein
MIELFKAFTLTTLVIIVLTAGMLLLDRHGIKALNRWFAAFLLCLTAPHLDAYLSHSTQSACPMVSIIGASLLWLKGPFMVAFMQVLRLGHTRPPWIWLHFAPWALVLLYNLAHPEQSRVIMLAGMGHMLAYLSLASVQLLRTRQRLDLIWHGFQNTACYWLLYVLFGLMALVAIDLTVMLAVQLGLIHSYALLDYKVFPLFSVFALSIAVLSLYRPKGLFRNREAANESIGAQASQDEPQPTATTVTPARNLELDPSTAQALTQRLQHLMEDTQAYRRNELSLGTLAEELGTSAHQLSELLNVHMGRSFYSFLNDYRIRHACQMLQDTRCQMRILDIAFESGFNNKNSFNRAFKDALGQTPNAYRGQARNLMPDPLH